MSHSTINSNIIGLEIFSPRSESNCVSLLEDQPDLHPRIVPRTISIYRQPKVKKRKDGVITKSKGLKGSKKGNLVDIPDLSDYKVLIVDPGTSSMGVRCSRRKNGKTENVLVWDTIGYPADSNILYQLQSYLSKIIIDHVPDIMVVELQLAKYGNEYTQHIAIGLAVAFSIPVIVLQPGTRYISFGLSTRQSGKKQLLCDIAEEIIREEGTQEEISILSRIKSKKIPSGSTVSAAKTRQDMLDTVTIELCAEAYLLQAIQEAKNI